MLEAGMFVLLSFDTQLMFTPSLALFLMRLKMYTVEVSPKKRPQL